MVRQKPLLVHEPRTRAETRDVERIRERQRVVEHPVSDANRCVVRGRRAVVPEIVLADVERETGGPANGDLVVEER